MQEFYRVEYSKRREISFATAFWIGFQQGLEKRFCRRNLEEQAIVLYDKVKSVFENKVNIIVVHHYGGTNAQGIEAGINSATNAQLNPGVTKGNVGNLLR